MDGAEPLLHYSSYRAEDFGMTRTGTYKSQSYLGGIKIAEQMSGGSIYFRSAPVSESESTTVAPASGDEDPKTATNLVLDSLPPTSSRTSGPKTLGGTRLREGGCLVGEFLGPVMQLKNDLAGFATLLDKLTIITKKNRRN